MASMAEQLAANINLGAFSKATELKKRLWFALGCLIVYRFGTYIPLPGIDPVVMEQIFEQNAGGIMGMFNMFAGGALARMSIFALGILPYISASIIMQLMTAVSPTIEQLKKEGEVGRKKINQYTRYLTVVLSAFQGYGLAVGLESKAAATEVIQPSAKEALTPNLDKTRTVGLVTLPGAFVGVLLGGGTLAGRRLLSPRTLAYVLRNYTGDRVDGYMGMPMHRGLGPHLRGTTDTIRGLGALASPRTFGHGGVGSSYCWADPDSGVSFAYLTNNRVPDPWHSERMDRISNAMHAAID